MASLLERGRTHTCGELRRTHVGQSVILFGWVHRRRDLKNQIFIQLRDRDGITQVSFSPDIDEAVYRSAESLRSEYCVAIAGTVLDRGDNVNPDMATGEIELGATSIEVFSAAETPPFHVADDDKLDAQENLRLRHRYLDLRRPSLQRNFKLRSLATHVTRKSLVEHGFYELETPYMVKYTPGGARNFLVPSRLHPGEFYALAESPQIYKQLFMVAGFDKYFQITRCFRDEDLRNDRQPEFTQIDVEISFATMERVFAPMEALIAAIWREVLGVEIAPGFPRMTWDEAMRRFGSDKPDTRFGLELGDVTEATRSCGFAVFEAAKAVKGLCIPPVHAGKLSRGKLDKLTAFVKQREHGGAKGLAWARIAADGAWESSFAKLLDEATKTALAKALGAEPGALVLFVADEPATVDTALCSLRLHLRDQLELVDPTQAWNFLWVTDFPLFERAESGAWVSSHHPFTSPKLEHVERLEPGPKWDPGSVRAQAYDLVLNGNEIGGGSIRIHRSDIQAKIFSVLGMSDEDAQRKFGFLLEAFKYGPPPHGGIALGLDRIAMLLCGAQSLRDVIAFPKTQRGQDLMTQCPTPVDAQQLAELHVAVKPDPSGALPSDSEPRPS
jgi:aspartyl-tRNA synthetase